MYTNVFYSQNCLDYFWRAKHKQQIEFYLYFYVPWENGRERQTKKREGKLDKQINRMTHRWTERQERKANEKD